MIRLFIIGGAMTRLEYSGIHGDPGKGKTMMAIAFIEEITKLLESDLHPSGTLA